MTDAPDDLPFCDFLTVTYSPLDHPSAAVVRLLALVGAEPRGEGCYSVGERGTILVGPQKRTVWVSATGDALAHLRRCGAYMDFLAVLSDCPHNVTRLDAALDVGVDAPPILRALQRRYKGGKVCLTRKGMGWSTLLSERPSDGSPTGTFYVGHRSSARVTARVYDKQEEARARRGILMGPCTRYEVTVRKDYGATLRDAAEPERLFWRVASPSLLKRPDGVPDWSPEWSSRWTAPPARADLLPAEVLGRRVSSSPEIDMLASIADEMGPNGRVWLVRQLAARLGVEVPCRLHRASQGLSLPSDAEA